jgi:hypothetical protein
VDEVVVSAQQDPVVEVGASAVGQGVEVVGVAPGGGVQPWARQTPGSGWDWPTLFLNAFHAGP